MDFEDDYLIDQQFGEWLREIRVKRGFKLFDVSRDSNIPLKRLQDLEDGMAERGITTREIDLLGELYGIDPRAIRRKAIHGDMD